jgi:hypothetical protein
MKTLRLALATVVVAASAACTRSVTAPDAVIRARPSFNGAVTPPVTANNPPTTNNNPPTTNHTRPPAAEVGTFGGGGS